MASTARARWLFKAVIALRLRMRADRAELPVENELVPPPLSFDRYQLPASAWMADPAKAGTLALRLHSIFA